MAFVSSLLYLRSWAKYVANCVVKESSRFGKPSSSFVFSVKQLGRSEHGVIRDTRGSQVSRVIVIIDSDILVDTGL
jgi:hypothetical protein